MGSQKSSVSTSYSGSGQKWAQPFAKQGVGAALGVYNKNQPNIERLSGNANTLSDSLNSRFGMGMAGSDQARQFYMDTLARSPQQNPYLDQILGQTRSDVANDVNSQFSLAGRYGSGAHAGMLTKEMANAENGLRYQDYSAQQARQDQAAGALTGANQGEAAQALGALPVAAELPYTGTDHMANQLAALFSGGNSKSVQYSPNPLWGALGAGLGAAGAYFRGGGKLSDRRLKKHITPIRERPDGLTVYSWVYKNDPDQQIMTGYMADEVKDIYPEAFIENFNGTGYAGVDYGKIPHEHKLAA